MTMHHLISEKDQRESCLYCGKSLSDSRWNSVFHGEKHYKGITCDECGHEIFIKVGFHGSGHDNWDNAEDDKAASARATVKTIENKLEFKVSEDFFIKGVKK